MRALITARVSHDKKGQGLSVAEQVAESRAWAAREGWSVVQVIEETGSASEYARSTGARTRWAEITAAVTSGDIDILITWEHSRATRKLDEYAELRQLCAETGVLWGYSGTVYNLAQRSDRFRTGIDALMSEDESARTSERVSRNVRARAAKGLPHGKIPYGYRREYDPDSGALLRQVPNEETAPVVREIFTRVAAGAAIHAIAADLTARGVTPPRPPVSRTDDQEWLRLSVRRIVQMPTYKGQRVHKGVVVSDGTWEALVEDDVWDRANTALASKVGSGPANATVRWLLTGIARCGLCPGTVRRIKNGTTPSYLCASCGRVGRRIDRTDDVVTRKVIALLEVAPRTTADPTPEILNARAAAKALTDQLKAFVDEATAVPPRLSAASLSIAERRLLPQIHAAEAHAQALASPAALAGYDLSDPAALWKSLDILGRRDLIRRAVRVTIHPTGGTRAWQDDLIDVEPTWL